MNTNLENMNFSKELDKTIENIMASDKTPSLLMHSCCAPCSSYCLEYLSDFFDITVLYYNPNIFPKEEYEYRISEQERLINNLPVKNKIKFISTEYTPNDFHNKIKGFEKEPEGGKRCEECFKIRLEYTANLA